MTNGNNVSLTAQWTRVSNYETLEYIGDRISSCCFILAYHAEETRGCESYTHCFAEQVHGKRNAGMVLLQVGDSQVSKNFCQ